MKKYTFAEIYYAKVGELTDALLDAEDRAPTVEEEDAIKDEARRYATEFMERYEEWQIERGHEERQRESERYGE